MHRTYELFVRQRDGHVRFEALTYPGVLAEVMSHVRRLVEEIDAESIEVRAGGDHLFTLRRS
jgi:hypothetical protein